MSAASNAAEVERQTNRAVESGLGKVGKATHDVLQAEAAKAKAASGGGATLLSYLVNVFEEYAPGISPAIFLNCNLAALTAVVGPVSCDFISSVTEDTQAVWHQNVGGFFAGYSPPGSMKSGTMTIVADACHELLRRKEMLRASVGGSIKFHEWLDHFPGEAMLRDGTTSNWFDRFKANPNLYMLFLMIDEIDMVLKRNKSEKSAGELGLWLQLWNSGFSFQKGTGVIQSGVHHIFGVSMLMGQFLAAAQCGAEEEKDGRGFGPRFLALAGHVEQRKWPNSHQVDYKKLRLASFVGDRLRAQFGAVASSSGSGSGALQPGNREYVVNASLLLQVAMLVVLHTIPEATIVKLRPQQAAMQQALQAQLRSIRATAAVAPGSLAGTPRPLSTPGGAMSTPDMVSRLGWSVEAAQTPPGQESQLSQSPDGRGRRGRGDSGSEADSRRAKKPPLSKEEADRIWTTKELPAMNFTDRAHDKVAAFFTWCEAKERESSRGNIPAALAAYFRKAKDLLLRIVPILHLGKLAVALLKDAGMSPGQPVDNGLILRLVGAASALPHADERFIVCGPGPGVLGDLAANSDEEDGDSGSQGAGSQGAGSQDLARLNLTFAHLICEEAVDQAVALVRCSLDVAGAVHSLSQARCGVLLKQHGFYVTGKYAHDQMGLSNDQFKELGKLASRNGIGLWLALCQVKWSGQARPYSPEAHLTKSGGHDMLIFMPPPATDSSAARLKLSAALGRCGSNYGEATATLYSDILTPNLDNAGRVAAGTHVRLTQVAKLFSALAFAAQRTDLITADYPGSHFKRLALLAEKDHMTPSFWKDSATLKEVHLHLYQLAILALQHSVQSDPSAEKAHPEGLQLLEYPKVPDQAPRLIAKRSKAPAPAQRTNPPYQQPRPAEAGGASGPPDPAEMQEAAAPEQVEPERAAPEQAAYAEAAAAEEPPNGAAVNVTSTTTTSPDDELSD